MPLYEYVCPACRKRSTHLFLSFAQVRSPACPHCGATGLRRLISRVAVHRSSSSPEDASFLENFDENDPKALGRMARAMSEELGDDLPPEYEDVVRELEAGRLPDEDELPGDLGTDAASSGEESGG